MYCRFCYVIVGLIKIYFLFIALIFASPVSPIQEKKHQNCINYLDFMKYMYSCKANSIHMKWVVGF